MDINQCIFPIYDGRGIIGQGVIADGLFITTAHVIIDLPSCFINMNGKRIKLADKYNPLSNHRKNVENGYTPEQYRYKVILMLKNLMRK